MLSAAQQRDRLERRRTLARLYPAHRSRRSVSPPQERPGDEAHLHHKEHRVQAHILICFLAYVVWKTLGQWCCRAGLGDEPRKVFAELAQISLVDVVLPTRAGISIRKRCVSRPTDHQAILLQRLGL